MDSEFTLKIKQIEIELKNKISKEDFHKEIYNLKNKDTQLDYRIIPLEKQREEMNKMLFRMVEDIATIKEVTKENKEKTENNEALLHEMKNEGVTFYDKLLKNTVAKLFKGVSKKVTVFLIWAFFASGIGLILLAAIQRLGVQFNWTK